MRKDKDSENRENSKMKKHNTENMMNTHFDI